MINNAFKAIELIILGVFTCLSVAASADFDQGMEHYEAGHYEKAYSEFLQAAKYGDYLAQKNIGAMYYHGQFVARDQATGFAWLALAAQANESDENAIHLKVYNQLSDENKARAEKIHQELLNEYGDEAIKQKLMPEFVGVDASTTRFRTLKRITPDYPRSMSRQGRIGWVDMFYTIEKDGTTSDHTVYYSTHNAFTKAAIAAIRRWQYEPQKIDGEAVVITGAKMRFLFSMDGIDEKRAKKVANELKDTAIDGNASEKLNYGFFLEVLPSYVKDHDFQDNPNEWYLRAAERGNAAASYFLGRNVLYGNRCTEDADKAMAWMLKAAAQNLSDAHYTLAIELFSGVRFERDVEKGLYWLQRAANGNPAAQLRYAWILATSTDDSLRNGAKAASYYAEIEKGYHDKKTLYQVAAAVSAENGDFKQAVKWQTKALKDATKLELPVTEINARLLAYQDQKPWREAL